MQITIRISLFLVLFLCIFVPKTWAQETDNAVLIECAKLLETPYQEIVANPGTYAAACEKVLAKIDLTREDKTLAQLYCNYTIPLYYLGEYEQCYTYNIKALNIFEKLGLQRELGDRYCAIGYQIKRRQLSKGFDYMAKGVSILEAGGFEKELCSGYDNFGVLHEMKGNADSALLYYNKSLVLKEKLNDTAGIPYSLNKIAMALLAEGDAEQSKTTLDRSISIRKQLKDSMGIAENYSFYGDYYTTLQQYEAAIENFTISLELAKRLNYLYLIQYNADQLSTCYEALNRNQEALSMFRLSTAIKDSLNSESTMKTISAMEARYESEKKEKELAEERERVAEANFQIKKQSTWLFATIVIAIALLVIAFLIYRQQRFKAERLESEAYLKDELHEVTVKSNLQNERLRISRDLHDNIGSQLTFIISSLDNHKFQLKKSNTSTEKIEEITLFARDTIAQLRDTIWAMNKGSISYTELGAKISEYVGKAKQAVDQTALSFRSSPLSNHQLNTLESINLFRVVQEAIQNAIKHANSTEINITLEETSEGICIVIRDNGRGFDPNNSSAFGNGLGNMETRIKTIGGQFHLTSTIGKGTTVSLKLNQNKA